MYGNTATLEYYITNIMEFDRISILSVSIQSQRKLSYEVFDDADHEHGAIFPALSTQLFDIDQRNIDFAIFRPIMVKVWFW